MDDGIEFNEAAFRHNVSEEDIRWVAMHPLYEDLLEGFSNKSSPGGILGGRNGAYDGRRSLGAGR